MSKQYGLVKPCAKCPFRTDVKPYLRKSRVRELDRALYTGEFHCHETTVEDDDGERVVSRDSAHCAGALILLEKLNRPSQMMRIGERLGMYDRTKLDMQAPVYDTFQAMIRVQPK